MAIKTQAVKKGMKPAASPEGTCGTGTCGCSTGGTCVGCDGRCPCKTILGCTYLGQFRQKKGLVAVPLAFILITAVQIMVHGTILMPAYEASSALWLPEEAMSIGPIYLFNIILAAVFTMLFFTAQKYKDYNEGLRLGMLLMAPLAAMNLITAATMPIPSDILWVWAAESLAQGLLLGALLTWISRHKCFQGKAFGGCGGKGHKK
ncbi:MAG: hypothetical protein COY40_02330 [Alphaproteobacteria bacterium CG_4_10_14_0_8_um_filter_53_9]|nr:MAG: hypothetical protein COY40_02330 [Alphaproteobacteria bacterium CG_4_10_14_0_8_um_filter_53_9]